MIIGLKGYAGAGKDAIAEILEPVGFKKLSFAETLRAGLYALNPIIGLSEPRGFDDTDLEPIRYADVIDSIGYVEAKAQYPEIRELLQRLGTELGRNILGENVWVDAALKDIDPEGDYVCTDMRFPNEYWAVRQMGGICINVLRPGVGPVNDHPSETAIDEEAYDLIFYNDGSLDDLAENILEYVQSAQRDEFYQTDFSLATQELGV